MGNTISATDFANTNNQYSLDWCMQNPGECGYIQCTLPKDPRSKSQSGVHVKCTDIMSDADMETISRCATLTPNEKAFRLKSRCDPE